MSYRVVITAPTWHLSGANIVSASLIRGLRARGVDAGMLLTAPRTGERYTLDPPEDIPVRRLSPTNSWPQRWRELRAHLTAHLPTVFIPNYDFDAAALCSALPESVCNVQVVHSDEGAHYQSVERFGAHWDGLITVSEMIRETIAERVPSVAQRTWAIPNGVDAPPEAPARAFIAATTARPLRVCYAGRLAQYQKRVFDFAPLLDRLEADAAPVELLLAGSGPDENELRQRLAKHVESGRAKFLGSLPNAATLQILAECDVLILVSAFEGLPIILLEAMARTCVPVVSACRSGIPEVLTDGTNGRLCPIGDLNAFARVLAELARDPAQRERLASAARETILRRGFTTEAMAAAYDGRLRERLAEAPAARAARRTGQILVPDHLRWRARTLACAKRLLSLR